MDICELCLSRIQVRATVDIAKDQLLYASYTYTMNGTYARQQHLQSGKFFTCHCDRCEDPSELNTNLSSFICKSCGDGIICSSNPLGIVSTQTFYLCLLILLILHRYLCYLDLFLLSFPNLGQCYTKSDHLNSGRSRLHPIAAHWLPTHQSVRASVAQILISFACQPLDFDHNPPTAY